MFRQSMTSNSIFPQSHVRRHTNLHRNQFVNVDNLENLERSSSNVNRQQTTGSSNHRESSTMTYGELIFKDPNPEIIRRQAKEKSVTYQQNVFLRFLKPPTPPAAGPLIIKEVREPQQAPPKPLIIRQHAKPLAPLPPLILRERPPKPPKPISTETVIRQLPIIPPPPRSVILEQIPPLPPKPRDIIIERWVPYRSVAERPAVVQKAPPLPVYPPPKNRIIIYDPIPVRVVRQFQNLGVVQEDPDSYSSRYGSSLLDPVSLVQQARAAGVVEDISPPIQHLIHNGNEIEKTDSTLCDLSSITSSQGFYPSFSTNQVESVDSRFSTVKTNSKHR